MSCVPRHISHALEETGLMIPFPVAPSTPTTYVPLNASQKAKAKQQHGLTPGCPSATSTASHQGLGALPKKEG